MRNIARISLTLLLCAAATGAEPKRPNVVIVLVDDMGWSDFGCYGSEIPTPNIDALAKDGLRYTQFYNTARCSPTRASLLTGLYPHQAGMGFLDGKVVPGSTGTTAKLADRAVTMAEVLGDAGYFTAMSGKWHLGQPRGSSPWKRGFQRSLNSVAGGIYFPQQAGKQLFVDGRPHELTDPIFGDDWYSTDLFTAWGIKFIDESRAAKKPFFLYLPYCAPHFPLMAPAKTIARFRGKYRAGWDKLREERHARQKAMGLVDPKWPLAPRPEDVRAWDDVPEKEKDRFDEMMAIYAAMIWEVDAAVGKLVAHLEASGELDNTILMVLSDNGGNAESGPGGIHKGSPLGSASSNVFLGMEWATLNNVPFRRFKHFTHEGGVATPLIVHWPAGIAPDRRGSLSHEPGHLVDIMATVVEATHAEYPGNFNGHAILPMAGRSLMPTFLGRRLDRPEPIYFAHEGNKGARHGDWKLVQKHLGPWELYNMADDRTELRDLSAAEPERTRKMAADWDSWAERTFVDPWTGGPRKDWGAPVDPLEKDNGEREAGPAPKARPRKDG